MCRCPASKVIARIVAGSMIGEMLGQQRPDLASRDDHHVILNLASTVGRAGAALSQQEG